MSDSDHDWRERLRTLADRCRSRAEAAAYAGVHKDQFQRYVTGKNHPPFGVVAHFAENVGASLDWIAWGKEPGTSAPVDEGLLLEIVQLVEAEAERRGRRPPADKIATLIVHCYMEEARHAAQQAAGQPHTADAETIRRAFRLVS